MNKQLRDDDAAALDLLLDRSRAAGHGPRFAGPTPGQERVRLAEKVLGLLQLLPDADPPHDLVDRTLRRVEQSAVVGEGVPLPPIQVSQPHA